MPQRSGRDSLSVTRTSAALIFWMSRIIRGSHSKAIRLKSQARDYILRGALTIRGVSREVELNVSYLGQWLTPWWEEEGGKWVDKGPKVRAGFVAKTRINRHDFGVSWNDVVDKGGVVV